MATVMNSHHVHSTATFRSSIQKVCIWMGAAFILMGIAGVLMPSMMGMHLSMTHNFIHLASGALALWCGFSEDSKKAYMFSMSFGIIYGLLGLAGFIIGTPGYPAVGNMGADQYLLRVIPNVLEFGSMDHSIHLLISAVFFYGAYSWKKTDIAANSVLIDEQTRRRAVYGSDFRNSDEDLTNADLGAADINRVTDVNRRAEFENKI